jgi:hypothetical protein
MSNGKTDDAEIDALLTGDQRAVDRYLVTGIRELTKGQREMKVEIEGMRKTCETRGAMCPGMHGFIADPVDPAKLRLLAAEKARGVVQTAQGAADETLHTAEGVALELAKSSRQTWAMWGIGTAMLERVLLPVGVVLLTLLATGKL